MPHAGMLKSILAALTVAALPSLPNVVAQVQANSSAAVKPVNALPNPYRTIADWAQMPPGRKWGASAGVAVDRDGNVWVAERCDANSCAGSALAPVLEFDSSGKFLKSFGAGMFVFPHGATVDKEGNVWVTDGGGKDGKGHQVFKFSPDGKVLLALGKPGVSGDGPETFNMPSAVAIAPNGDIFVADGHDESPNARIVKFSSDGKFIKTWGKKGSAPGEFKTPHGLAFDSKGRLFVADRANNRIQIFDQDGNFIAAWTQFSRPSGVAIDQNDVLYVADSESGSINKSHGAWKRGIRIGSAKDGSVSFFIPDPNTDPNEKNTSGAEGIAVGANGIIYGAEVGQRDLKKYAKN